MENKTFQYYTERIDFTIRLRHRLAGLITVLALFGASLGRVVRADVTVDAAEVGGNVVFTYSGMIDLTGLTTSAPNGISFTGIETSSGGFYFNSTNTLVNITRILNQPAAPSFGIGGVFTGDPMDPTAMAFGYASGSNPQYWAIPLGYVSGTPLTGTQNFTGHTFATLGLDTTPFVVTFTNGENILFFGATAQQALAPVSSGGGSRPADPPPLILTDAGAILSAETTGLNTARMLNFATSNASQGATRDLNERIWRLRSGLANSSNGGGTASTGGDLRALEFASNQMIDYRVALGLADGEEVEITDTLASSETAQMGHPFAMLGGLVSTTAVAPVSEKVVVATDDAKNPTTGKEVAAYDPPSRFGVFTSFDYGYYDQDQLTRQVRGFEVDNYAGSLGGEYKILDWLAVGGAFSYVWSDVQAAANLGSIDQDGQLYSVYSTAVFGNTYVDALYSYGDFENEISRNTLLGSNARGDTDSHSHNVRLNAGHNIAVTDQITVGPTLGWDYSNGGVDGYNERNGGAANLSYFDQDFESMVGRLGGHLTFTTNSPLGKVTLQGRGGWGHEFMPENDTLRASLQSSPFLLVQGGSARRIGSYTAEGSNPHAGQDWLELGAGVQLDIGDTGLNRRLDYEGQFARNNASAHFGSVKLGYEW